MNFENKAYIFFKNKNLMIYFCHNFFPLFTKKWPRQIDDLESAKKAGDLFGFPLMIKSKRLAYDGRGNAVAKSVEELSSAVNGNKFVIL